jgi:hypothetical protein
MRVATLKADGLEAKFGLKMEVVIESEAGTEKVRAAGRGDISLRVSNAVLQLYDGVDSVLATAATGASTSSRRVSYDRMEHMTDSMAAGETGETGAPPPAAHLGYLIDAPSNHTAAMGSVDVVDTVDGDAGRSGSGGVIIVSSPSDAGLAAACRTIMRSVGTTNIRTNATSTHSGSNHRSLALPACYAADAPNSNGRCVPAFRWLLRRQQCFLEGIMAGRSTCCCIMAGRSTCGRSTCCCIDI